MKSDCRLEKCRLSQTEPKKFKGRAGHIISLKLESQNASVSSWSVIYSCFLKNMQFPSQSYCENRHKQSAIHRILLSSLSCHWFYFNFVDWDAIHFTITKYSDLPQYFYPLISSNTQRKSSWDSILLMEYKTLSSSVTEYIPRNLCLTATKLPGLLEDATSVLSNYGTPVCFSLVGK